MLTSQAKVRPSIQANPTTDESDGLVEQAREASAAQLAVGETVPLEIEYTAAFETMVEAKRDQAERIEVKLELLKEQQVARLQQIRARRPGFLASSRVRGDWQRQVQQQQLSVQRLEGRLEAVREIREGMGSHALRIEELAARKLQAQQPDLADGWLDLQTARRRHEELMRREVLEKRRAQRLQSNDRSLARSLGLTMTVER